MRLIEAKIKSSDDLRNIVLRLKGEGRKIIFTNGCFDILHYGHINYLQNAKRLADVLIVAINSDSSVMRIKGKGRPVIKQKDRMRTVAALEAVDFVTSFSQNTPLNLIKLLKPDILVKGRDWSKDKIVGRDIVDSYGGKVITLPFVKGQSSSKIIKRIGEGIF